MSERPQGTTPAEITASVVERFDACPDARLRQLMQSLAKHLHAFAADVELTEEEWHVAIRMLTETGHITDERRQEFILWSDTMGLSMLVDAMAHELPAGATESTVLGPFDVPGSPVREHGANIAEQEAGLPAWVHGRVLSIDGSAIASAELDIWQNGDNRLYAVQDPRLRSTTCAAASRPAPTAPTPTSRCAPCPIRSPTTDRWARCWPRPGATPGARRTST